RVQRPGENVGQERYYARGRGEGGRYNPYAYGPQYSEASGGYYYDDRAGWDNASGYRDSANPRSSLNTTDPMQRQWNSLRSGSSRPNNRWGNTNYDAGGYRDYDSLLGSDRVSSDAL